MIHCPDILRFSLLICFLLCNHITHVQQQFHFTHVDFKTYCPTRFLIITQAKLSCAFQVMNCLPVERWGGILTNLLCLHVVWSVVASEEEANITEMPRTDSKMPSSAFLFLCYLILYLHFRPPASPLVQTDCQRGQQHNNLPFLNHQCHKKLIFSRLKVELRL